MFDKIFVVVVVVFKFKKVMVSVLPSSAHWSRKKKSAESEVNFFFRSPHTPQLIRWYMNGEASGTNPTKTEETWQLSSNQMARIVFEGKLNRKHKGKKEVKVYYFEVLNLTEGTQVLCYLFVPEMFSPKCLVRLCDHSCLWKSFVVNICSKCFINWSVCTQKHPVLV